MPNDCLTPDGDCTPNSPCGMWPAAVPVPPEPVPSGCGAIPVADGVYTYATITVEGGCIILIQPGEPPVYTPEECCPSSTGGGGSGGRGPKGDPGRAATIDVSPTVLEGDTWALRNIGTQSAAILQLTVPRPDDPTPGETGVTGRIGRFTVKDGLVTGLPDGMLTEVTAAAEGTYAGDILFQATPVAPDMTVFNITLNLDMFRMNIIEYVDEADEVLRTRLELAEEALVSAQQRITNLESQVSSLAARVTALEGR